MGLDDIFTKKGIFPNPQVRVTHSGIKQDRSESSIAVDPNNSSRLVGVSKRFIEPTQYTFTLAGVWSDDGGYSWHDSSELQLLQGWEGLTDPAVAFDDFGNVYLLAEPLDFQYDVGNDIVGKGMWIYKSTDGGKTWSAPVPVHANDEWDDKQWLVADNNPSSSYYGRLYGVWGVSGIRFARSYDHGATWHGVGTSSPGTTISPSGFSPEVNVDSNGNVHVFNHQPGTDRIQYLRSFNGGESFTESFIADNIGDLSTLISGSGFPKFPGAKFRVLTLVTACTYNTDKLIVAWADYRNNVSRIYYKKGSYDDSSWNPSSSGEQIFNYGSSSIRYHDFHPQIIANGNNVIGCSFYRYYESSKLIDVMFTASFDGGESFWIPVKINSSPWDPAINAPNSHGDVNTTFIGDYFGIDADLDDFFILWTNTKDGVQELYFNLIHTKKKVMPKVPDLVAEVFGGVASDGGGWIIINGHLHRIPPRGPDNILVNAILTLQAAKQIRHDSGKEIQKSIYQAIQSIAESSIKELNLGSLEKGKKG